MKGVAALAAGCASFFVVGWVWLRAEDRDCEWECVNFPAVALLLGLAAVVLICLLVLVVMIGLRLGRGADRTDEDV